MDASTLNAVVDPGFRRDDLPGGDHASALRFITCGSVDDGKSTLIGRLLYDSKQVFQDQYDAVEQEPADQRALAVVDRSGREKAQRPALARRRLVRAQREPHQK